MRRAALLAVTLWVTVAAADEGPRAIARVRLEPPGAVVAGQSVRIAVDVLVTTWLTKQPQLPPLELAGAVVAPSDEASNLTERIEGTSWFGVSLSYLLTPTQGGDLDVPAIDLTAFVGQATEPIPLRTAPLVVAVIAPKRPPGAERLVGATRLELTQHLDRTLDALRVGDAVKRTIEVSADGVRAMFLPPVAFPTIDGLAVYPDPPQVDDVRKDRVGFTGGRRIDAASYVVQKPGDYELAAVHLSWWDTGTGTMRTVAVPAVRFHAAPNPDYAPAIALPADEAAREKRREALVCLSARVAALLIGTAAVWLLALRARGVLRTLGARRAARRRRWQESEEWAFEQLRQAARGGDAVRTYGALARWVERVRPDGAALTIRGLSARAEDVALAAQIEALEGQVYGGPAGRRRGTWSGVDLADGAAHARQRMRQRQNAGSLALGPLNPM